MIEPAARQVTLIVASKRRNPIINWRSLLTQTTKRTPLSQSLSACLKRNPDLDHDGNQASAKYWHQAHVSPLIRLQRQQAQF